MKNVNVPTVLLEAVMLFDQFHLTKEERLQVIKLLSILVSESE